MLIIKKYKIKRKAKLLLYLILLAPALLLLPIDMFSQIKEALIVVAGISIGILISQGLDIYEEAESK
jgi:TRAP-type uncharacterized transport system fused permease subunit